MIRSHDYYLENLRRKSQKLAQELQGLKFLRDQVRRLEASDQSERRRQMLVPFSFARFQSSNLIAKKLQIL